MAVSYSYLYTGTSDTVPNTKYKSRLTLNVEQTGDIWNAYYGPMRTLAIHSNDRGYSYIQSSVTKQYLSRNNYGALVWWTDPTPNYSDWLISYQGDLAYKTTLLNLKADQHSYLVWNKDDGSTNWWSTSAGNDTWKTYWGLTSDLPRGKYRFSCGNMGVIREPRARLYYGRTTSSASTSIYVIDEEGFNPNNPISQYRYYTGGAWKYSRGTIGDATQFSYSYMQMIYTINRGTNVGISYSDSFNPQDFCWTRKDGTVSYLDIFNTLDVTFVGNDNTRSVKFQPVDVAIPIKNARQQTHSSLGLSFNTGGTTASTAYVSSEVICTSVGNIQIEGCETSPFQMSHVPNYSWIAGFSYTIFYDVTKTGKYNASYYNAYILFRYSYVGNNNNMNLIYHHIYQPQNPLFGLISYEQTVSYIGKGECTSEIELPSGLSYVSHDDPLKNSYIKINEVALEDNKIDVETYAIQTSSRNSKQVGFNLAIGGDKTVTYPALHSFTMLESLQAINVPVRPFKYSDYTIEGVFPHLKQETNSFIDIGLYESAVATTNWIKKNDFKVYLNKDNVFKFPLKDVVAPIAIDIPLKELDSSLHSDEVWPFEFTKEHSLFLSPTKKYNLVLGSTKTDLIINEEPRQINNFVNSTNRSHVYYLGTPLFVSGSTVLGTESKNIRVTLQRYSPYTRPVYTDLRTVTGQLVDYFGFFTMLFIPGDSLKLSTKDQLIVLYELATSSTQREKNVYDVKDPCNIPYLVYYINSLGGVDVIPLNECTIKSVSATQSTYNKKETVKVNDSNSWLKNYNGSLEEVEELTTPYNIQTTKAYACKTPFLDETQLSLHSELFDSMQVFLYNVSSKEFTPVVVSTNSYSIKNKKQNSGKPVQMSFTLTEASTNSKTI